MRVKIERSGRKFNARILDGYRTGELLESSATRRPIFDVDRRRFVIWLTETGYEVINKEEGDHGHQGTEGCTDIEGLV